MRRFNVDFPFQIKKIKKLMGPTETRPLFKKNIFRFDNIGSIRNRVLLKHTYPARPFYYLSENYPNIKMARFSKTRIKNSMNVF